MSSTEDNDDRSGTTPAARTPTPADSGRLANMGPWAVRGVYVAIMVWSLGVNFLFGGLIGGALTGGAIVGLYGLGVPLKRGLPGSWREGYAVVPAMTLFLGAVVALPVALLTDWPTSIKIATVLVSMLAIGVVSVMTVRKLDKPLPSEKPGPDHGP